MAVLSAHIHDLAAFSQPQYAWKNLVAKRASSIAALAAAAPKGLTGRVGATPWDFAEIIAAGYEFVPQPSLQQYLSVTPKLRKRDAAHFAGQKRPEVLLFNLKSIDNRYAPLDYGRTLLEIIASYDPVDLHDGHLVLASRTHRRLITERLVERRSAHLGEWLEVPPPYDGFIFASMNLPQTLLGDLITFAYKQPQLMLDIRYGNGRVDTFHYVPILGEDGFFLLPYATPEPRLFIDGEASEAVHNHGSFVGAIRLRQEGFAGLAFASETIVQFNRFTASGQREVAFKDTSNGLLLLTMSEVVETAGLSLIDEGLFAHTPTVLRLKLPAKRVVTGSFGFLDRAWQTGRPKPTTFVIASRTPGGQRHVHFERTLDPIARTEDRGQQSFEVALPEAAENSSEDVEVTFETKAVAGDASWGWTYWGGLYIQRLR
jgi:hypothetical protein